MCKKIKKDGTLGDFYFETEAKNPLKTQNFKENDCNKVKDKKIQVMHTYYNHPRF